jgi:hypothetical protein
MLRIFLALWLALTPAFAWAGSMSLLGVGKPQASGAFTPASISGLIAWYKADAGLFTDTGCSTAATNGQAVACWKDQSSSGYNQLQATSGNRPVFSTTGLGGDAGVTFTAASGQFLNTATDTVALSGSTATICVVYQYTSNSNANGRIVAYGQPGAQDFQAGSFVIAETATNPNVTVNGPNTSFQNVDSSGFGVTSFTCVVADGTNVTGFAMNVNQGSIAQANGFTTGGTLGIATQLNNGSPVSGSSIDGVVSEITVYNAALNSTQLGQLQTYFASRW